VIKRNKQVDRVCAWHLFGVLQQFQCKLHKRYTAFRERGKSVGTLKFVDRNAAKIGEGVGGPLEFSGNTWEVIGPPCVMISSKERFPRLNLKPPRQVLESSVPLYYRANVHSEACSQRRRLVKVINKTVDRQFADSSKYIPPAKERRGSGSIHTSTSIA